MAAGTVKALYLAGELPALDQLAQLELLVVQDSFLSPQAAQYAHVALPAASFAESSGTLTNLEGRRQHFEPAIPPVGESHPDWWIACQLAQAMGLAGFQFEQADEIVAEVGAYAGAPVQLAASTKGQSTISNPQSSIFNLLVERNQFSYRGSALTARVHGMSQYKSDEQAVRLSPADAAELNLQDGDLARVTSEHGSDTLRVLITPGLPGKTAFTSINAAHGSALFPGKLPEVKAYAVTIERAG
jgi:predicted molibdopterin-dependent oxidoreductase YjgC